MLAIFVLLSAQLAHAAQSAAMPTWTFETVDRSSNGNRKLGMKLGPDGRVHLAYTGCTDEKCENNELMYATRESRGAWVTHVVDSRQDDTGWFASLALDAAGAVHLVYSSHAKQKPYLYHATLLANGKWQTRKVGETYGGYWTSVAQRGAELLVANTIFPTHDFNYPGLQLATAAASGNGDWRFEELDRGFDVGWFPSLALDANGLPAIAYSSGDYDHGRLLLHRQRPDGSWQVEQIDGRVVKSSLAFDALGFAHIAYTKEDPVNTDFRDLMYATNFPDGSWHLEALDGAGSMTADTGYHPNLAFDAKGGIHVTYYDRLHERLMYARKLGAKWEIAPVRAEHEEGFYSVCEVDEQGVVHLAFDIGDHIVYARGVAQ